jgi:hypothetical protein
MKHADQYTLSPILVLTVILAGCDFDPAGPGDRAAPLVPRPTFVVIPDPGSPPPESGCGPDEGYQFSSHFSSSYANRAEFRTPSPVSLRSQCGDLPFDDTGVGTVDLYYKYVSDTLADYEMWARRRRNGVARDTLPGGSVNTLVQWTDAVTRSQTYSYQVRHLVSGAPGRLSSPPHSAVANPVAPASLLCSGTTDTTITCQWADTEPDTILVYRSGQAHR